ncbi:MAG: SAM-dependent methyltransferase [Patescibacteria group bacterium]
MTWLLLVVYILTIAMAVIVTVVVFFWESSLIFTRAPFIPSPAEIAPQILSALELDENSVLYDLGCGEGHILRAGSAIQPKAKFVGIERSWLPYFMAIHKSRVGHPNLKFIRSSFFKCDLADANRVFIYLFPGLMNDLLPKLQRELKPGTRVVSCDFEFKGKQPIKVIDLGRPKNVLGRRLLVYQF